MAMAYKTALLDKLGVKPGAGGMFSDAIGGAVAKAPDEPPAPAPISAAPVEDVAGPQSDNTGIAGGIPKVLDQPLAAPAPAFTRNNTRLMEGDAGKLADPTRGAKSPKYDFLQLANQGKYGYDQLGDMLKELQAGPNAAQWQGWTADRDKLKFTGDRSQLAPQWKGVTTVDAIGGFNSGNPQGFRWGAEDPNAMAGDGGMGPHGLDTRLMGDPTGSIQQALAAYSQSPNLQALLAQLGAA